MEISNIISLLSGVALFLFGMSLMGEGLKSVAGNKLELVLYKLSSTPLRGVLLGTGVTAVIQSSSATSVMVVGFVNSGMMKVRQAIGIVMGAILGTSITGWIICLSSIDGGGGWVELLSTATLTGIIAVVGIILRMFCKKPLKHHIGDILMGFAVLMSGIAAMTDAVQTQEIQAFFASLMTSFSNPALGILAGVLITSVLQSASAAVGILQTLAITGAVDFSVAFPIVLGIAIGAAVPVLLSAVGANVNGRRTAFVYLLIDVLGAAVCGIVFYGINAAVSFSFMSAPMTAVSIALLNTLFRLATVIVLFPFIGFMEKIVCFLFKDAPDDEEDASEIDRLEDRFIAHPALAIEQSRTALNSMARKAGKNLSRALTLVYDYSDELFRKVQEKEDVIDRYEDKLGTYLVKINTKELTREQNRDISIFLHTITDFERIADHAVNLAEVAREMADKKIVFSGEAQQELDVLVSALCELVTLTQDTFREQSLELAYRVEPLEECIDNLCDVMKLNHIRRVQEGNCTLNHGFVFNDLLTNYERIADHCSNVAVAMIELAMDAFDTHEYLNQLKERRTDAFSRYYEEYSQKYLAAVKEG